MTISSSMYLGKTIRRLATVVLVTFGLTGCAFFEGGLYDEAFWSSSPFIANTEGELGIAELAKGNYVTAEGHFQRALEKNPRDVHALMGAGILYQNTGQFVKAREMYEAVLAIRPDDSEQFVVWNQLTTRPASQVASVNLSLLETGGNSPSTLRGAPGTAAVGGAPQGDVMLGRTAQTQVASAPASAPSSSPALMGTTNSAGIGTLLGNDANIVSRFETLKALRDQGLVTEDEYAQRRRSNVGALLPLTSPPSSAGLERPVPTTEQISARLRAIGRALEMRAISVSQHAAERNLILDALMPAAPVVVDDPAIPPQGLMEAADAVRRLEQLRDEGYISSDEYARERQAIELVVRPKAPTPQTAVANAPSAPAQMMKKEMAKPTGPQPAVHLASYRSAKQAQSGWTQIRRAHRALLGDLNHEVSKVTLGSKGTYYRLKAGPLKNASEARTLCRALKSRRQFCDTTVISGG